MTDAQIKEAAILLSQIEIAENAKRECERQATLHQNSIDSKRARLEQLRTGVTTEKREG